MILPAQLKRILSHLNLAVPEGHTWIVVLPEIGNGTKGQTTYLTPITEPKKIAEQLRAVANAVDPQN